METSTSSEIEMDVDLNKQVPCTYSRHLELGSVGPAILHIVAACPKCSYGGTVMMCNDCFSKLTTKAKRLKCIKCAHATFWYLFWRSVTPL